MTNPNDEPAGVYCSAGAWVPAWAYKRLAGHPGAVDFYIWLNLYVVGEGGQGYKRNAEIAAMLGISERQVKRRIAELRTAGVVRIERFPTKNGRLGQNVYVMMRDDPDLIVGPPDDPTPPPRGTPGVGPQDGPTPPPAETSTRGHNPAPREGSSSGPSINPETSSTHRTAEPLRGSPAPASPAAEQPPLIPDEILDAEIVDDRNLPAVREEGGAVALNAGVITREWVDYCARGGVKLPNETIKRYAAAIRKAADEHFPESLIRATLTAMARDRVIPRPSLFATYLARVQVGPELPPERVGHAEASRIRQAQDAGKTPDQAAAEMRAFLADVAPKEYRS